MFPHLREEMAMGGDALDGFSWPWLRILYVPVVTACIMLAYYHSMWWLLGLILIGDLPFPWTLRGWLAALVPMGVAIATQSAPLYIIAAFLILLVPFNPWFLWIQIVAGFGWLGFLGSWGAGVWCLVVFYPMLLIFRHIASWLNVNREREDQRSGWR
jgi:hypothetical protein